MNTLQFQKADYITQEIFNPRGMRSHDAILMCTTDTSDGFAPYDLTILDGCPSSVHGMHYLVAHGCVIEPLVFKTIDAAKTYIIRWYFDNRQKMHIAA
jgi:hypothetical protein